MRALQYRGSGRVAVVEVPDPQRRAGDALVRIEASALCGSEREALVDGFDGNTGHEACGEIIDPGDSDFGVGDRVGMAAVHGCGTCVRCVAGQELHCEHGPKVSTGWHAELAAVSRSQLRRLPSGTDPAVGALASGDALGVPVRGLRRAPTPPGAPVLIIGLGPVGLSHLVVRSFEGASVSGVEPSAFRRKLALDLGAASAHASCEEVDAAPYLVIECTGRPECIEQALQVVDNGGAVLQSGECRTSVSVVPAMTFIRREITYTGSWYYATEDYARMLALLDRGLPLERVCTHVVAAADAQAAVTDFLAARSGKVVFRWSDLLDSEA